jgi:hypothetical protein
MESEHRAPNPPRGESPGPVAELIRYQPGHADTNVRTPSRWPRNVKNPIPARIFVF